MFDVDLGPRMKITESELNVHGESLTTVETGKYSHAYVVSYVMQPCVSRAVRIRHNMLLTPELSSNPNTICMELCLTDLFLFICVSAPVKNISLKIYPVST